MSEQNEQNETQSEATSETTEQPPVTQQQSAQPDSRDGAIEKLSGLVETLGTAVTKLTEVLGTQERDSTPVKVPWTHRGGRK